MATRNKIMCGAFSAVLFSTALTISIPALADHSGAFVGGMLTAHVIGNMHERTEAEQQQAYYAQQNAQPVQQAAPAKTAEQKLDELNKLAAGGYITPEEYKSKKAAVINNM